MIKRILKWLAIILIILVVGLVVAVKVMDEPIPASVEGPAAEALATEVLNNIKHDQLADTKWVSWAFPGNHKYVWHVPSNHAQISYGSTVVKMDLDEQTGVASRKGEPLNGDDLANAIARAWSFWCNDSWWLIAPHKIMDPGTTRSVVDVSADHPGKRGLLVQYESGGVTPGDAYLWLVDADGMPTGYEMWTAIIPIGGIFASWDKYEALHSGALVSTEHDMGILKTGLGPLRSGDTYNDVGLDEDIFASMR
jgi:hypothetical protein